MKSPRLLKDEKEKRKALAKKARADEKKARAEAADVAHRMMAKGFHSPAEVMAEARKSSGKRHKRLLKYAKIWGRYPKAHIQESRSRSKDGILYRRPSGLIYLSGGVLPSDRSPLGRLIKKRRRHGKN